MNLVGKEPMMGTRTSESFLAVAIPQRKLINLEFSIYA